MQPKITHAIIVLFIFNLIFEFLTQTEGLYLIESLRPTSVYYKESYIISCLFYVMHYTGVVEGIWNFVSAVKVNNNFLLLTYLLLSSDFLNGR